MMINLNSLVNAIQKAALIAGETISKEHFKIFSQYFEGLDKDFFDGFSKEDEKKSDNTKGEDKIKTTQNEVPYLKPRMVKMQFQKETANGVEMHDVYVPLLTLMPISMPQVSKLKFTTDLELYSDADENIRVSFPTKEKGSVFHKDNADHERISKATVEISLDSNDATNGLKLVIEGYDKMLRAQIPG